MLKSSKQLLIPIILIVLLSSPVFALTYIERQETANAFYTFDFEDVNGSIQDTSGNNRNATVQNVTWFNNSAEFNFQGVYGEFNNTGSFIFPDSNITLDPLTAFGLSFWYKSANTGQRENILYYGNGTDSVFDIWYQDTGSGAQICFTNSYGAIRCVNNINNWINPSDGAWNFVTILYSQSSGAGKWIQLRANGGTNFGSGTSIFPSLTNIPVNSTVYIGGKPNATANNSNGYIKAVGFFPPDIITRNENDPAHIELYNFGVPYDPCVSNWVCIGYDTPVCLLNDTTTAMCNSVNDTNVCGDPYTGDYTEFANQTGVCDYCTPIFSCSEFNSTCLINDTSTNECLSINDSNSCYSITNLTTDLYNGSLSDFDTIGVCDFCTPNTASVCPIWNTSICINDTNANYSCLTAFDSNGCFEITNLSSDEIDVIALYGYRNCSTLGGVPSVVFQNSFNFLYALIPLLLVLMFLFSNTGNLASEQKRMILRVLGLIIAVGTIIAFLTLI